MNDEGKRILDDILSEYERAIFDIRAHYRETVESVIRNAKHRILKETK